MQRTTQRFVSLSLLSLLFLPGCIIRNKPQTATQNPAGADGNAQADAQNPANSRGTANLSVVAHESDRQARVLKPSAAPKSSNPQDGMMPNDGAGALAVSRVVPNVVSPGAMVEILGSGFDTQLSANQVRVGGIPWPVAAVYKGRLIAKVPPNAVAGIMEVNNSKGNGRYAGTVSVMQADSAFGKPATDLHGLLGLVFPLPAGSNKLPDFSGLGSPAATIVAPNLDMAAALPKAIPTPAGALGTNVALRFIGSLNIVEGAEYKLCLSSDDGSALYLQKTPVIDNNGVHRSLKKCELVYLEAGEYEMEVHYFNGSSPEMQLQLSWSKAGGEEQVVPSSALYRPEDRGASLGVK